LEHSPAVPDDNLIIVKYINHQGWVPHLYLSPPSADHFGIKPSSFSKMQSTLLVIFLFWLPYILYVNGSCEQIEIKETCQYLRYDFQSDLTI
jgi:hypothetical protein